MPAGPGGCLTTDGRTGDGLTQGPCVGSAGQVWSTTLRPGNPTPAPITNPASSLYLDVSGNCVNPGATIIGWMPTGQANQSFAAS